ncbi:MULTISPECIES: 2-hydroxyacid dehydrogenase [unclassified Sphingomonas]|uniref:2-hydroxyacid dehydrogenase n=1 Tax=unclassified Sphingomonas TaxID=196159 RepID=UPI0006F4B2E8|nr:MULTISPECIES: D-glycerate dehydrogenase [unclassified Sphingomonas]KQX23506.1 D-glycerate dehydrogenase [Sphingomonas sp. Root1294]KQY68356.1 D-glycerate dehydrogenase [Sphingomonas sp. Root50]KRB91259.1 D-glycerate dehydrogenase [Sphingomonas sp. Root720]
MARILLTRRWPRAVEDELAARHDLHRNDSDRPMSQQALAEAVRAFDVICPTVSDRIDAAVIGQGGGARMLANFGAGVDHIDLAAARAAGMIVTNTPDVLTEATAELAVLLMLMVSRRAGEGERELRSGEWTGWRPTHLLGRSMHGRTLGLIGYGRIAQETARRAQAALGVQLAYYSRRALDPAHDPLGARYCRSAEELVAGADIVSLHCPGGAATHHLIDAAMLRRMKPDAVLINTARGSVVDEAALAQALTEGRIGGAGLDVYQGEPAVDPRLLAAPNLVLLPHLGSATVETREAMGCAAVNNLEAVLDGREPPDRVV